MNISFIKPKISVETIFSLFFTFAISLVFVFAFSSSAFAAKKSDHVLHGYIWSDNIGWISLNCADTSSGCGNSDYKVVIDYTTGELSGYAWSSNIGWVSFQETTGCPNSTYYNCRPTAALSSASSAFPQITGWARALSHNSAWDGWISLSCYNTNTCGANNYGVVLPNDSTNAITADGSLSGYAWGSTVTGWLNFAGVTVVRGSSELTLTASVNSVNVTSVSKSGDKIRLTWSSPTSTNYTSCTASNDASDASWVNSVTKPSSSSSTPYTEFKDNVNVPTNPTTYTISCTAGAQTDTASVTIDINYVWDITIISNPEIILSGGSSIFDWQTNRDISGNVPPGTNCVATNPNGWTSKTGLVVQETLTNILASITRSVTCTPPAPDSPKTASASVNVMSIINYSTDSCYRSSDGGPTISWIAPNAQACYISKNGISTKVGPSGRKKFANGPGDYDISCVGGSFTVSDTLSATACVPDYIMTPLNMCNGKSGQLTDNAFQPDGPTQYKATIKVDATPEAGFSSQLRYKFTMPSNWISNNWSINGWSRVGLTDDYESPIVSPGSYNSSFDVIANNKASAVAGLASLPKKTQTFTINGDTNPSIPMARSASYTICAPDGGNSKPIFIEQ